MSPDTDLDTLLATGDTLSGLINPSTGLDALIPEGEPESPADGNDAANEPTNTPFGDVQYTGDLETDAAAELTAAQAAFRDRSKTYKRQRLLVEDSEFWVAVCFRTRADKEAFLRKHGLAHLGDKYLNGYAVDAALTQDQICHRPGCF